MTGDDRHDEEEALRLIKAAHAAGGQSVTVEALVDFAQMRLTRCRIWRVEWTIRVRGGRLQYKVIGRRGMWSNSMPDDLMIVNPRLGKLTRAMRRAIEREDARRARIDRMPQVRAGRTAAKQRRDAEITRELQRLGGNPSKVARALKSRGLKVSDRHVRRVRATKAQKSGPD